MSDTAQQTDRELLLTITKQLDYLRDTLDRYLPLLERYERASQAGSTFRAFREMRKNGE